MEKEELGFSVLQPILFVIASPAIYYVCSDERYVYFLTCTWIGWIFTLPLLLFVWKHLRITVLMLLQKPAVILTDEIITITERGYSIYWADIMDVFMSHSGSADAGTVRNQYVAIMVREPEKYIKAIKNPFTRYYRWYTRKWWSLSPFEVSLSLVRGDDDENYQLILKYYQHNRLYFRIP